MVQLCIAKTIYSVIGLSAIFLYSKKPIKIPILDRMQCLLWFVYTQQVTQCYAAWLVYHAILSNSRQLYTQQNFKTHSSQHDVSCTMMSYRDAILKMVLLGSKKNTKSRFTLPIGFINYIVEPREGFHKIPYWNDKLCFLTKKSPLFLHFECYSSNILFCKISILYWKCIPYIWYLGRNTI